MNSLAFFSKIVKQMNRHLFYNLKKKVSSKIEGVFGNEMDLAFVIIVG